MMALRNAAFATLLVLVASGASVGRGRGGSCCSMHAPDEAKQCSSCLKIRGSRGMEHRFPCSKQGTQL